MIGIKLLSPGLVNGFKWAPIFCGTACICFAATGRASTGTALATWLRRPGIYESLSACALPCQSNVSRLGTKTVKHLMVSKEYLWLIQSLPPYFIPKTSIRRSDVLCTEEERRFQTQICQLVVLRPLLYREKVCQREFFRHPSLSCWLYEASGADKLANTLIISA